ncbi:recombinase family protein [Kitasatospora purpeofusca]|uniref:recombinase family protein n=1 Tax=Kitasatospora purpeofusca TaxID=67352 RepID=UPI0036B4624D
MQPGDATPVQEEVDLYLRKSKRVRAEDARDLLSVQTQEELGRAWAAKHGKRVRKVWVDNLSAWSDVKRPEFDGAVSAVLAGEVPTLWCAFLDRFTRKGAEEIVPILGKARVIFDYEGLDSSIERDRRWIIDRAEQAREFSQRLSFNLKSTKATQRNAGKWLGKVPYGFELESRDTRKLQNRTDTWRYVLHVFKSVALGIPARMLVRALNSGPSPIPSPGGGEWQASTVSKMIWHPVYEGWQVSVAQGAVTGEDAVYRHPLTGERISVLAPGAEPVPPDIVRKARTALQGHMRYAEQPTSTKYHLLTDLARCAGCRGAASGGRSHVCARHTGGKSCPAPVSVLRLQLEEYVAMQWFSRMNAGNVDDPLLWIAAERYAGLQDPETAEELSDALAAQKTAEARVQRIADGVAAGMYDPPFDAHLPRLQSEARAALQAAVERVAELAPKKLDIGWLLDDEKTAEAWEAADHWLRRDLLRLVIRRIVVAKGVRGHNTLGPARVEIHWLDQEDPWVPKDDVGEAASASPSA